METVVETPHHKGVNGAVRQVSSVARTRKQRVTITLPVALLERLRNAVYWTGHGTLARLITDALAGAVAQMEQHNGGTFPARLTPLRRGRPRSKASPSMAPTTPPRNGSIQ
ncbi:MAG TPA: hypothetical protein VKP13_12525 [Nitrospira sp.]|nr:hypothetical protein [Nitrospira sp.]